MEDNAKGLAAETELKKFGSFADEYVNRLDGLCNLSGSVSVSNLTGEWCRWDCDQSIILPNSASHEYGANLASLCGVGRRNTAAAVDNRLLSKG